MAYMIGQTLGHYHITEQLGEGGMATVYKAFDTHLERDVAVKVIRTDQFAPAVLERILKRFEREAKLLGKLSHPNIVNVIDYGEHEGIPYLVMEYLPGGTLKQILNRRFTEQESARILLPIASALDYAHRQGMIHRDIKPSNILISIDGAPKLTDFGIAKLLESEETQTLTGTGIGMGTPEYMAPEQWTGNATPASDQYSLGVIFYEMVTGHKPFSADTPAAILLKQAHDPLPDPRAYATNLSKRAEGLIYKMMALKVEGRYADMQKVVEAIRTIESGIVSGSGSNMSKSVQTVSRNKETKSPMENDNGSLSKKKKITILPKYLFFGIGGIAIICLIFLLISAITSKNHIANEEIPTAFALLPVSEQATLPIPTSESLVVETEIAESTPTLTSTQELIQGELIYKVICRKGPSEFLYGYDQFVEAQPISLIGKNKDGWWIKFHAINSNVDCWTIKTSVSFPISEDQIAVLPAPEVEHIKYAVIEATCSGKWYQSDTEQKACDTKPTCSYTYQNPDGSLFASYSEAEIGLHYWGKNSIILTSIQFTEESGALSYFQSHIPDCPFAWSDGKYLLYDYY